MVRFTLKLFLLFLFIISSISSHALSASVNSLIKTQSKATPNIGIYVKNLTKETEHTFELVNPEDANIPKGKIPLTNPIGKSLEGSKEGDEVKVGPTTFKVIKVN